MFSSCWTRRARSPASRRECARCEISVIRARCAVCLHGRPRLRVILRRIRYRGYTRWSNEKAAEQEGEREGRFFVWPSGGGNRVSPRGGIDRRRRRGSAADRAGEPRDRVKGPAAGGIFGRRRAEEWNSSGSGNGSNSGGGGDAATATATAASTAESSNSRRPGANNLRTSSANSVGGDW